jgi:hypothetical protein
MDWHYALIWLIWPAIVASIVGFGIPWLVRHKS